MSISFFLLWLLIVPSIIHAVPETRGYLLSCGSKEDVEQGSLKYIPDEGFTRAGNRSIIKQSGLLPLLATLRYFPDASARKYCYVFPVVKGSKFLVKTIYYYGGFDGGNDPPVFDQIVDGTTWSTVNTTADYAEGLSSYYEIVIKAHAKTLSVCLARNEHTVSSPFISAVELQYLDDSLYNSSDFRTYALRTVARHCFGAAGDAIGFPDDQFNRFWQPYLDTNPVVESHSNITPSSFWNIPPANVFTTAITTSRGKTLTIKWPPFSLHRSQYYVVLYFQDNRPQSPSSWRVFDVNVNGEKFYDSLNVTTSGVSVYSDKWPLSGQNEIALIPGDDMAVGPLINAGEVFQILPLGGRTLTRDVKAMESLARSFDNPPLDWSGDPCLPKQNSWSGVVCSEGKRIRIVSLNLTSFGLSGSLPRSISKLTALSNLWVGDNKLAGTIPDMTPLKALQTLHMENNQFEGEIPESLGNLPQLHEIFLHNNNLRGSVPDSLTSRSDINLQVYPGNNLLEGQ